MLNVAIIDPNPVFALGLKLLVARGLAQAEVWNYVTGAARALEQRPADLIVISERLIAELASSPIANNPAIVVIVDDSRTHAALAWHRSAGFANFLLRDSPEARIAECLQAVASGRRWVDPELRAADRQIDPWHCLSKRQLEVALMAARGLSNKHIARNLKLSDGTVKIHLHHVFAKLQVRRRRDLGGFLGHRAQHAAGLAQ